MALEIERRFLVLETGFLQPLTGERIIQGYVAKEAGAMTTRVRIRGQRAYLTLKGPINDLCRDEFEYPIPVDDARQILASHCGGVLVEKTRYLVDYRSQCFEVDVFHGRLSGLTIAELELARPDQHIQRPPWLGPEVTGDKRYGNYALAQFGLPTVPAGIASPTFRGAPQSVRPGGERH